MKQFVKIIMFIPVVNFISFFLYAIFVNIKYTIYKKEWIKFGIFMFLSAIIFVILINVIKFINIELLRSILFLICIYLLGISFSIFTFKYIEIVE